MNRWSKYGGIMPETININNLHIENRKIINQQGQIADSTAYCVTDFIYVNCDKVSIKIINKSAINYTGAIIRATLYKNGNMIEYPTLIRFPDEIIAIDKIYKFIIDTSEADQIRICYRMTMGLLEIEKL